MTEVAGNLHISNDVIAEIVGKSVIECYGVVGVSDAASGSSAIRVLTRSFAKKGVAVAGGETGVKVDIYVVLEYGVNISVVTKNLRDRVEFVLGTYVKVPVESIDIHVTGIKIRR